MKKREELTEEFNNIVDKVSTPFNKEVYDEKYIQSLKKRYNLILEELVELAIATDTLMTLSDCLLNYKYECDAAVSNEVMFEIKTEMDKQVAILDALCDIEYIHLGTVNMLGFTKEFNNAFEAVHASNMSKFCSTMEEAQATLEYYKGGGINCYIKKLDNNSYCILRQSDEKLLKSINYNAVNLKHYVNNNNLESKV